jgi:hypothetical protein
MKSFRILAGKERWRKLLYWDSILALELQICCEAGIGSNKNHHF